MTIISALVAQCRREYGDNPKSVSVSKAGNGSVSIFNVGKYPVIEGSYLVYVSGNVQTETTHYTYDLDNGDLVINSTPANNVEVKSNHKYAFWRDKNWVEAINQSIDALNGLGFFKQVLDDRSSVGISAGIQYYSGPANAIDVYELKTSNTISGTYAKTRDPWTYQQDANKIVFANKPTIGAKASLSYLRNLKTYSATSATIDVLPDWEELVKKKAGSIFYRSLAGKIAKQGNATIDEGHFSFSNLRAMANDLDTEFDKKALRKKPARPAKDIHFN
jgi:hypothetical protein